MPQYADEPPADPHGDIPIEDLLAKMAELPPSSRWWLKWTCRKCGDRVTCDEEKTVYQRGFSHTIRDDGSFCGGVYTGHLFGVMVEIHTGE